MTVKSQMSVVVQSVVQNDSYASVVASNPAVGERPAVAGLPSQRQLVTKEQIRRAGKQPWIMSNTALKSIRDSNERPVGAPSVCVGHRPVRA